ncbi:MAG: NYN domain-containing protein [Phycisphaerales bacterium]
MLILDAYNILHAARDAGVGRLDHGMLKEWIASSRYASQHAVLVYDGRGSGASMRHPAEPGIAIPSKSCGISELHAGPGLDADTVIERILEHEDRLGRGRQVRVVSSDKRVRAAATAARAKVMGSREFLGNLVEDVRKRWLRADTETGGRPAHATDSGADPARTVYWLREFGSGGPHSKSGTVSDIPGKESGDGPPRVDQDAVDLDAIDMERLLAKHPPSASGRADGPPEDSDDEPRPRSKRSARAEDR